MKTYLVAASAAALLAASALAADSRDTRVFADVEPVCTITNQSVEIDLTNTPVDTWEDGEFTYQCNFVGSPILTFRSANGGLVNPANGGDEVDYGIYLNDNPPGGQTPSGSLLASSATGGVAFDWVTTTLAANTDRTPTFAVGPLAAFTVAGTYEDVLTIEIAP